VIETIQLLVILILTAFAIVVILVGSGMIFRKGFAQIDFCKDLSNNPVSKLFMEIFVPVISSALDNI
jgi:hypothetical protein